MSGLFTFCGAKKIVFGRDSLEGLAGAVGELRGSCPFIVMDARLAEAGLADRVREILGRDGLKAVVYSEIDGEPLLETADRGAQRAKKAKADIVVGIGGGSALDSAKAIAVVAGNNGKAVDYLGLNRVPGPGFPKIMVPTTAGTGSEVTFTSVFIRKDLKKKEGMNSPFLYPDMALLDPLLTLSVPPDVTATTGIDALCHAIESLTSIQASPMSEMFSLEAIGLIAANIRTCVHNGSDIDAREAMLLGSLYAGLGLANAGVTAVHSLSYPLGGRYGVPHGLANTVLLPAVMRFNLPGALEKFAAVAEAMGEAVDELTLRDSALCAVAAVEDLICDCGVDSSLETLGVGEDDFQGLAEEAMTVARPLANNPRNLSVQDAMEIYHDAY
ncbi:MAG: iron-containing alcohol dehydrogenase [Syntrophales bacterium]|jgi:alcohol dehydrogenase|nr:iron-containing alcohol dehydrogenase [Syntrophales bacterium]MCK9527171.1 iron-containing alcohol dehydrogenase [Syntrophales bacterium]MDX9921704.1 iron-containing alcohol dehydrogenase [Syntrophales bacterium]